jgi:glycine/D-amino acid oxidase-like deaminating enzyme
MRGNMPASASSSAIVVGAGVVGACVAHRLAADGARVTVVDAGTPGSGASGASFAWANSFGKTPREYHDLNVASMAEHERLAEELGGSWLHRTGNLLWEETPDAQMDLRRTADRLRSWGYAFEVLRPREALELEPDLSFASSVEEVVYPAHESWVEVVPMIGALLAAAVRRGARVVTRQRVTGLVRAGDGVRGVVLADGSRLEADVVVDCAGAAAGEVAGLAETSLPVAPEAGRLVYTTPVATALSRPIHAPGVHFRPDGGGRIVLAEDVHDLVVDRAPRDGWTPERSIEVAARYLPALGGAAVEATRIGPRPMPRDRHPIVGPVPGRPGLYVVVSHSGVTLGPLWGRVAAAEILTGRPDPRLDAFRATRFP